MSVTNTRTRWLAFTFLALAALIASVWGLREWQLRIPQRVFNAEIWKTADIEWTAPSPTLRQQMIRDLVVKVLPGKDRSAIEDVLGESPSHDEMRRFRPEDLAQDQPYPRTGKGHYYDEHDWDLIYPLGRERVFIYDHRGVDTLEPDDEFLILRLSSSSGKFESWYVVGSLRWPSIVGELGRASYKAVR